MFTEIPRERRVSFAAAAMFEYSDSSTPVASRTSKVINIRIDIIIYRKILRGVNCTSGG
jgi:hypothetical protein